MTVAIALVDLDDTLFQSLRKCPEDVPGHQLTVMARDRAGAPLSFATPRQMAWIDWLRSGTLLVPVTGRSVDALNRVELDFDYAVAAHGGVVLRPGGELCAQWHGRIGKAATDCRDALEEIAERFRIAASNQSLEINVRLIGEADLALYVVAKHRHPDREIELHQLAGEIGQNLDSSWTLHINGNNVAFLPPYLGKRHAVAHLLEELRGRHPDLPVIGLGDSLTDAPFLQLCDFAMMPSGSQLARRTFEALGLT